MNTDRLLADVEALADLPVGPAGHDLREHAALPDAEAERLGRSSVCRGRRPPLARRTRIRLTAPSGWLRTRSHGSRQELERFQWQRDPGATGEVGERPKKGYGGQVHCDSGSLQQGLPGLLPTLAPFAVGASCREDGRGLPPASARHVVRAVERHPA